MKVHGDYYANGYAKLEGLFAPEVANEVLAMVHSALATSGRGPETFFRPNAVLARPAFELYGSVHASESYVNNASGLSGKSRSDFISAVGLSLRTAGSCAGTPSLAFYL